MSDHDNHKRSQGEAADRKEVAPPEHQYDKTKDPNLHDAQNGKHEEASWPKLVAITSLAFDGIIAIGAIWGFILVYGQLELTRQSNRLTADSNVLTRAALEYSVDARAEDIKAAAIAAEEELRRNDTRERAMAESNRLTRESNELTRKQFESAEILNRAWIVGREARLDEPVAAGQGMKIGVQIENIGRIPALDLSSRATVSFLSAPDDPTPTTPTSVDRHSVRPATIAPGAIYSLLRDSPVLTDEQVEMMATRKLLVRIEGQGTYRDAAGYSRVRTFEFCFQTEPDFHGFAFCSYGNRYP